MDPLSATGSIIAVLQLLNKVVGYLNDVKNASKDRAKCAMEAASLNSLLTTLRFRLEEGDSTTPWYTSTRALGVEDGPLDQFKQALEELQSGMTSGDKLSRLSDTLVWRFKKEEVTSILNRMDRLKSLVQVALQMDHFKLSQAIKDCGDVTRRNTEAVKDDTDYLRREVDLAKHSKLLAWISPTDFPAQQSDFISRRQEGTGQWFLNSPEFAQWLGQPQGTLFCPGIPGAGKTMVAAIAVDHLLKTVQSSSVGVAYVYCNYKAEEERDAAGLLAAILKQLLQAHPSLIEPVERLHAQHAIKQTEPSIDEILTTLQSMLAGFSTSYVVIDALDECQDVNGTRRLFLAKLRELQANADLRLMATSRSVPDVVDEFQNALRLEVRARDEDVMRFVTGQVHRLPKCIQRDTPLQGMVRTRIVEAVDGMFLLARLHTDSLLDKRTPKDVKSTLAKLSKGSAALDDAYREAIQRIEGQLSGDLDRAKKVLSWITYAQRPLTTAEICCALAVEPGEEELDPENVPDVEDLVSVCAGLVVVDEESAIIRLVHYTTQEYLERIREQWIPSAQLGIASTCLTYLSFGEFRSGICPTDGEFEERLRRNEFLDYAASYWGNHILPCQGELFELSCSFLLHPGLVSCATQAFSAPVSRYSGYAQQYARRTTGLHLAAQFGLRSILHELLTKLGAESERAINTQNSDGETPLSFAASWGHVETVKLLLDMGAGVNTHNSDGETPLSFAASCGYVETVKLLLDKGADVNAQGGGYNSALQAASTKGHESVVKLLLHKGANVNLQGRGYYHNALYAACFRGHKAVVKLLLENGASIDALGDGFSDALQVPANRSYESVASLLTERETKLGSLHDAVSRGSEAKVKELLAEGIDINSKLNFGDTALTCAAICGRAAIVRMLLEQDGIDINRKTDNGETALLCAAECGNEVIVRLLLEKGAVDDGFTVLSWAAKRGHERVVKLLLEEGGIDVNSRTKNGFTALWWAAKGGHEMVVKLLLTKGAAPELQDSYGETVISRAAVYGPPSVLKLLLDVSGAKADTQDYYGRTTLWWAAAGGNEAIVELLLSKYRCKPDLADNFGRTPLSIAIRKRHRAVVEVLLPRYAENDMDIVSGDESTCTTQIDHEEGFIGCDVCTLRVEYVDFHYHCWSCADGDFDICMECVAKGATCLDGTHKLVKRSKRDGIWEEEIDC